MAFPAAAIAERLNARDLDGFVVAAGFGASGAAFALGDGTLHRAAPEGEWTSSPIHDGAILAMAPDARGGFVTGGDDGLFRHVDAAGEATTVASFGAKWVEQVAAFADGKSGLLACAVGRGAHLFQPGGGKLKTLDHPSSVTGLVFDAKGKRVAASHYNGASLWFVGAKVDSARVLDWKGSHTGIAMHPGGEAVVTAMQENALHGWRLSDGQHMRMSGYPSKTESLSFSRSGKWLASSGADTIVLWPFFGGGPMGKAPTELAGGDSATCTRVAFSPKDELVAAGFSDGLVVLVDVAGERVLPVSMPSGAPVTALAWKPDGTQIAFGTEAGRAAVFDLAKR